MVLPLWCFDAGVFVVVLCNGGGGGGGLRLSVAQ